MTNGARPTTIAGDWDRFYLEFPDVYDRFARSTPPVVLAAHELFDFAGKVVVDAGSGTGASTFELARIARFVVGLEPWDPMREFAAVRLRSLDLRNVAFIRGAAEHLPFPPGSVDAIVSFWGFPFWFPDAGEHGLTLGRRFVADGEAIVRSGGALVAVASTPGWAAGELTSVVYPGRVREVGVSGYMEALGFAHRDVVVDADYGSVQEAVETYGFIFGQRAIDHLVATETSSVRWKLRIYHRRVDRP